MLWLYKTNQQPLPTSPVTKLVMSKPVNCDKANLPSFQSLPVLTKQSESKHRKPSTLAITSKPANSDEANLTSFQSLPTPTKQSESKCWPIRLTSPVTKLVTAKPVNSHEANLPSFQACPCWPSSQRASTETNQQPLLTVQWPSWSCLSQWILTKQTWHSFKASPFGKSQLTAQD